MKPGQVIMDMTDCEERDRAYRERMGYDDYDRFLAAKVAEAKQAGFDCDRSEVNSILFEHQKDVVLWAVRGGRRAVFSAFGMGKSVIQLEIVRIVLSKLGGGRGLIIMPLGVRQEFVRDAKMLGTPVRFVRTDAEADQPGIYLTNYESVREGKIDPSTFDAVSLDEAAVLRGFGGTKTFREFMVTIAGDDRRDLTNQVKTDGVAYRFVCTATPSPNEFIELLAYAAFLGVMDVGQGKTRFFKRNSEKADQLTLHPHKEAEFWSWVSSWAVFVQRPSDLGYSDEGYELPPLDIRWHEIPSDHEDAGADRDGQARMFKNASLGITEAAREKRESLPARIAKLMELRAEDPDAHRVIWHDLEAERHAIEQAVPGVVSVYGSQDLEEREAAIIAFGEGRTAELAAKPVMLGAGVNFQHHCSWAIYLGIGFRFHEFIQSIHRLQRFQQPRRVRIDLIYTEAERGVRRALEAKWARHKELVANMTEIIRKHGLSAGAAPGAVRSMGVERVEVKGNGWTLVNEDSIRETRRMQSDSVDLIVSSIPFSHQYEYSPNYADLGHTDDNDHFWRQMDFLTPELYRILEPGRIAAIHVKDRITPGGINGFGFQTVHPFSDECVSHFRRHGFAFLSRITVVTDVVRENAQTYRLGWTEQCKDGSRMGNGMPEYVLVFRKPPSDRSNGYADVPVVKSKEEYPRAQWQFDAHGFRRSSGDRLLAPEDLEGLTHQQIFRLFKRHSLNSVYDFQHDVMLAMAADQKGMLPSAFMLLQPQSRHPEVWADVVRMRTLNTIQAAKGREQHLCPLPFDIVDRLIVQYSMEGELVFDPFAGLGTVPYCALKLGRRGYGVELSPVYFADATAYMRAAEAEANVPTLFTLIEQTEAA